MTSELIDPSVLAAVDDERELTPASTAGEVVQRHIAEQVAAIPGR